MNKEFAWILTKRFLKGFVAGGLSSVIVLLQTQPIVLTQDYAMVLVTAFLTGGLLMINKAFQGYQP